MTFRVSGRLTPVKMSAQTDGRTNGRVDGHRVIVYLLVADKKIGPEISAKTRNTFFLSKNNYISTKYVLYVKKNHYRMNFQGFLGRFNLPKPIIALVLLENSLVLLDYPLVRTSLARKSIGSAGSYTGTAGFCRLSSHQLWQQLFVI